MGGANVNRGCTRGSREAGWFDNWYDQSDPQQVRADCLATPECQDMHPKRIQFGTEVDQGLTAFLALSVPVGLLSH